MLKVDQLYKKFGGKPALKGVSFEVQKGEIFGLLGHNGAGKSTTMGIILGMIAPSSGSVSIGGVDVQKQHPEALRKVGAIFESPAFYEYMSGWDNLKVLMELSGKFIAKDVEEVVERVGLTERIKSKVGTYSHGMRQRLALAQALLPEPEILLLDEPTDGLDPEGIKWFRDFILNLRKERGMTVLFNSHLLSEVEQMCDRVAIIRKGERVFEGEIKDLRDDQKMFRIEAEPEGLLKEVVARHQGKAQADRFIFPPDFRMPALVKDFVNSDGEISSIEPVYRSLEDVYLEVSQK